MTDLDLDRAPFNCDAHGCPLPAPQEFTVGQRPPGVQGLEGWPDGAPDLADTHIPSGRVLRFCYQHAHQLREAAYRQEAARPFTVDGIHPHD